MDYMTCCEGMDDQESKGGLTAGDVGSHAKPLLLHRRGCETKHVEEGHRHTSLGVLRVAGDTLNVSTAMRAFSLVLVIVQIVAVASANRYYSPISGCQVTLDNYRFDLCPLLSQRNNSGHLDLVLHHQTPPTITTIVYNISLDGPLRRYDAISDHEQVSLVVLCCCAQSI